ncbi:hypothetical protein ABZ192_12605 [Streptomyces sp. NPDC006235]|jgi:hypothetical protein|uniref:hypothetical protein n=1 Tax=Streptomyces sp. NPDC006235 TaxID=3156736 RepID=UPI0033B4BED1
MGKRGVVTDYAGNELYPGDLIAYSARNGNRVRMADAVILPDGVSTRLVSVPDVGKVLVPVVHVQPTGVESGFAKRRTGASQWITAEHVRLVKAGFVDSE